MSRIQTAAIMTTYEEMADLIADIETNRELMKRLTARAVPFTAPAARAKMDANRIVGVCGNDGHVHVAGLLTVLDSYHIKARMPVLMALIVDDFTAEDYQEWKSSVFQGDAMYGCSGSKQKWSKAVQGPLEHDLQMRLASRPLKRKMGAQVHEQGGGRPCL